MDLGFLDELRFIYVDDYIYSSFSQLLLECCQESLFEVSDETVFHPHSGRFSHFSYRYTFFDPRIKDCIEFRILKFFIVTSWHSEELSVKVIT